MKRYYLVFTGRVQGVGFRWFAMTTAANLGLTGWVRNLDNGDVDCEVQGSTAAVQSFIREIKDGNHFIRVDKYTMKQIPVQIDKKFIMRN